MGGPTLDRTLRGPWPTEAGYRSSLDPARPGTRRRPDPRPTDVARTSSAMPSPSVGSITVGERGRDGSRTLSDAGPLAATLAIVALGTGALFLAANQGPPPVVSPSPATWTPPPSLVTQDVAPGVLLITDDGAGHELQWMGGFPDSEFAFAPDGSLWLLHHWDFIRVGDEAQYPAPQVGFDMADLTAAPDGTLWALSQRTVASFRDGAWVNAPRFPGVAPARALEVLPDGTVWARSATTLARLDGDAWTAFPIEDDLGPITDVVLMFPGQLAWTPDGTFWVASCGLNGREQLLRFDGATFERAEPPIAGAHCFAPLATGPNGELWTYVWSNPVRLARYDGTGWSMSADDAGIPAIHAPGFYVGAMTVAPDGRVWAAGGTSDRGSVLGVYDGTTWTDVVGGVDGPAVGGAPIAVAPDGTVWLLTERGFFVATP